MDNSVGGQGRTGIHNPGNFCYVNAFLQCLAHTDPFRTFVLKTPSQEVFNIARTIPAQYRLAFAIHSAITQMWSNNYASIRLDAYRNAIIRYAETEPFDKSQMAQLLRTNGQQDTHEFIVFLTALLHECYKRPCVVPGMEPWGIPATNPYFIVRCHRQRQESIIHDLFRFFSVSEISCIDCHSSKYTDSKSEPCLTVTLPNPIGYTPKEQKENPVFCDLTQQMDQYFEREEVEVSCQVCKQKAIDAKEYVPKEERTVSKAEESKDVKIARRGIRRRHSLKSLRMWTLPDILMIQLKRFSVDPENALIQYKNECYVRFPLEGLDMGDYVSPINENEEYDRGSLDNGVYDLYAVINHSGGLNSGHYTAYVKPSHDSRPGLGWRHFNDQVVTPFDPRQFESVRERQQQAYMLFYRRRDA